MKEIQLSIGLENSGVKSIPGVVLQVMSQNAVKLLSGEGSVVLAPGCPNRWKAQHPKSHYVSLSKNGKVTCEGYPGWKTSNICTDALAATDKAGTLTSCTKRLGAKGPTNMNVKHLVTYNSSSTTGKNRGKASTARCKCGRRAKLLPATQQL